MTTLYRPIRNDGQTGPEATSATQAAIWITQQPDSQLWRWEQVGGAIAFKVDPATPSPALQHKLDAAYAVSTHPETNP